MFRTVTKVKPPEELKELIPFCGEHTTQRARLADGVKNIISGGDKRKLAVVGPCSADRVDAVLDYAERLARVAERIKDRIAVVMRVYTCKPRTRGAGYMGILHNPDPSLPVTDISAGLRKMRELHVRIAQMGLLTADEMVYPETLGYIEDVVSYVALGARSSLDPLHRFVASGLDVPVGVKNSLGGGVNELVGSVHAVRTPCEFLINGNHVRTDGNAYAHAVLRGVKGDDGTDKPNCGYDSVMRLNELCLSQGVTPSVVIDVGHSNSAKHFELQPQTVTEMLSCASRSPDYNAVFKGFMVESYIEDGCQAPNGGIYGKSVTDGCLGWQKTEELLLKAADAVV